MSMIFGMIGRLLLVLTGVSVALSAKDAVDFVDRYSDEIEVIVESVSEFEDPDDFFDNSVILSKEEYDELVAKANAVEEASEECTDEKIEAEKKAEEEKIKAEEEAKKAEEEKIKAEEEAKKAEEEAIKAEEEAKKKAEEEAAKKAEEEAKEAEKKAKEKEAATPAPAPAGKTVVDKVYMEDCGMDTGYWIITYSDGSVEYIDD